MASTLPIYDEDKFKRNTEGIKKIMKSLKESGKEKTDEFQWLNYKHDMWLQGSWEVVDTNQPSKSEDKDGVVHAVYRPPVYQNEWFPAEISYSGFMDWRIKKLLSTK